MYKEEIDVAILRFVSMGFVQKNLVDPVPPHTAIPWQKPPSKLDKFTWTHIQMPVYGWIMGLVLSSLVFITEKMREKCPNKRSYKYM